jgi:multiple sugar transport system permease protein
LKHISLRNRKIILAWLLIAPAVIIRVFTSLYPMIQTFIYSFMDYRMITRTKDFIGLQNFTNMFTDSNIQESIHFTILFTVISIIFHIIFGIGLALMLNIKFRGRKFLRSIILIPWAIPAIVAGIAAQWAFNDTYGFVNDLIGRFIHGFNHSWLIDTYSAQFAVIATDIWKDTPFFAILILAGLQGIPGELYESASIDGASNITIFRRITLPHLKKLIITLTVFFTLWRLTGFDLVYAMTQGGPGAATSLLSYRVTVEAFKNLNFGYASSIAVLLFLIMLVVATIGLGLQRKIDD